MALAALVCPPATVTKDVVEVDEVDVAFGRPVLVALVEVLVKLVTELLLEVVVVVALHPLELPPTASKLAQVIRVVLPKWNTKPRFPKNAPIPSTVEAKLSVYVAVKVELPLVSSTLPCLPARSPT